MCEGIVLDKTPHERINPAPQIGDMWKFDDDKMHFLILDEQFDEEDGTLYDILILESGKMDTINRGSVSGWGMVKVA